MTLVEIADSQECIIQNLVGHHDLVVRLMELGFTKGEPCRIVGRSLFGSPLFVEIRGTVLALRDSEAKCIQINQR